MSIEKALGILLLHSIRYLFDMACLRSTKWETFEKFLLTPLNILYIMNEIEATEYRNRTIP